MRRGYRGAFAPLAIPGSAGAPMLEIWDKI